MKKRLITLLIAFIMMFALVVPAYASGSNENTEADASKTGGMDFYSITINYTDSILVDYTREKVGKEYLLLFESSKGDKVLSDKVVLRAGVTQDLDYIGYDKSVPSKAPVSNFYQLYEPNEGIAAGAHYSKFPYDYAYITHIQDGAILQSKSAFSFYGIFAPYDEGGAYKNQNPNVEYDADGYALDKNKDADGNYYRIDANEFRIDKDGLWYDESGYRVELFYQEPIVNYIGSNDDKKETTNLTHASTDELIAVDYASRFDENGKVLPLEDLNVYYYITADDYNKFIKENKATATGGNPAKLPLKKAAATEAEAKATGAELVSTILTGTNKLETVMNAGNNLRTKYFYVVCSVDSYRVSKQSSKFDGDKVVVDESKTMVDDVYKSTATTFSSDFIARDAKGNRVYSTPIHGEPKLKVEIESITVEIDAVGTVEGGNDLQKNNKITVSINDFPQNIALKEEALADKWILQETFDAYKCKVLGTVNSETTTDKAEWNSGKVKDGSYKDTVKSLKLNMTKEELNSLPLTGYVYLSFDIETHQPEDAFNTDYIKYASNGTDSSLSTLNAYIWTRPAEKEVDNKVPVSGAATSGLSTGALIGIICGGVAVLAAIVVVLIIVLRKKK